MFEIEYVQDTQDEIYYWLVFTVFFSSLSVLGATLFVIGYKLMIYLRDKKIKKKGRIEYGLVPNFDNTKHNMESIYED
jgi:hypothetical protein